MKSSTARSIMPPATEPLPFALSVYRIVTAAAGAALAPLAPCAPYGTSTSFVPKAARQNRPLKGVA
jgi:hypothetical protein